MCGESRTHSSEGVVEGRPSTTTLQRRMWAFLMIHLCDKMSDAISRLGDALIVIEVNFFLFEGADESFSVSVLPRPSSVGDGNLNAVFLERCDVSF